MFCFSLVAVSWEMWPPASSSSTISVSELRIAVSTVAASLILRFAASFPTKSS